MYQGLYHIRMIITYGLIKENASKKDIDYCGQGGIREGYNISATTHGSCICDSLWLAIFSLPYGVIKMKM